MIAFKYLKFVSVFLNKNYRKYSLGLLYIENYLKNLTMQCNQPIRMESAAHTFQYHLEYCRQRQTQ